LNHAGHLTFLGLHQNSWADPWHFATHFLPGKGRLSLLRRGLSLRQRFVNHSSEEKEMHPGLPLDMDEFVKRTIRPRGKTGCN
jgi:hypothetical protein